MSYIFIKQAVEILDRPKPEQHKNTITMIHSSIPLLMMGNKKNYRCKRMIKGKSLL